MINDIKLGLKIMKYGHSAKMSFIISIALAVFGLLFCVAGVIIQYSYPGGYFVMLAVLLLLQLLGTVNAANLVGASPRKKKLQTSVPALISTILMLGGYLMTVATLGALVFIAPKSTDAACYQIIYTAVIMGGIMLYYGACFKYFIVSTAIFVVVFCVFYPMLLTGELQWEHLPFADSWGNFGLMAVIGLAVVLICGFLQYLISLAVYKMPLSKMALGARLRNQL